jgi:acetolactate synthase-1/2/3 large subunit
MEAERGDVIIAPSMAQPPPPSAQALLAAELAAAGTTAVFGVPGGGQNLDFVEATQRAGMQFVLAHTETAAVIMAAVHGELTGAPGACVVTRGPGLASATNGIAHALLDRQPVVVVADCVPAADRDRVPHQRLPQTALAAHAAKATTSLGGADPASIARAVVGCALAVPAGPVEVDVDEAASGRPPATPAPAEASGDEGACRSRLAAARRPVVALGIGALRHVGVVRARLAGTGIPVLATYRAKGIVSDHSAEAAGLLTGGTAERPLLDRADLVIGIGLDPVELIPTAWPYADKTTLLDEWDSASGGWFGDAVRLTGPLEKLIGWLDTLGPHEWEHDAGRRARKGFCRLLEEDGGSSDGVTPQRVVTITQQRSPSNTRATVDAGAHMLAAMPLWEADRAGDVLISSGLATMGFALPGAIAAAVADPARPVACLTGDGGLTMVLGELETLARLQLPVVVVVFNDASLSLIKIKQRADGHGGRDAVEFRRVS